MQTTQFRNAFTQGNIGTTACHVGSNGYSTVLACMRNNLSLFFMVLRIQHVMRNVAAFEHSAQLFGLSNGSSTNQYRTAGLMAFFNLVDCCLVFGNTCFIDNIRIVNTDHRLIGRYNNNRQIINLLELLLLSLSGTGHAGELFVHTEVVLEGNSCQCLAFAFYLYAFLSFDSLMQAFGETTAEHQTAGKFINDDNLTILNHIIAVAVHQSLSLQSAHNLVRVVHTMLIVIQVADAQHFFCLGNTLFGRCYLFLFFINSVILALFHVGNNTGQNLIQLGGFFTGAGDNQRGTRFVNQDTVDLIDNTVIQLTLNHLIFINYHVITQIVKAEFVICTVSNICSISSLTIWEIHIMHNQTYRQTEELVNTAHILAVAACQIIIDSYNMHALAGQRVQIYRRSSYQCFTFAGTHLGNFAAMQHYTTD